MKSNDTLSEFQLRRLIVISGVYTTESEAECKTELANANSTFSFPLPVETMDKRPEPPFNFPLKIYSVVTSCYCICFFLSFT